MCTSALSAFLLCVADYGHPFWIKNFVKEKKNFLRHRPYFKNLLFVDIPYPLRIIYRNPSTGGMQLSDESACCAMLFEIHTPSFNIIIGCIYCRGWVSSRLFHLGLIFHMKQVFIRWRWSFTANICINYVQVINSVGEKKLVKTKTLIGLQQTTTNRRLQPSDDR